MVPYSLPKAAQREVFQTFFSKLPLQAMKDWRKLFKKSRTNCQDIKVMVEAQGYQGHLDIVSWLQISGWVWKPGQDVPLELDVLIDGCVVARRLVADIYRPDVEAAGFGNGRCGFDLKLDPISLTSLPEAISGDPQVEIYDCMVAVLLLNGVIASPIHPKAG